MTLVFSPDPLFGAAGRISLEPTGSQLPVSKRGP